MIDCTHIKGKTYNKVVATRNSGICNICGKRDCNHNETQTYDGVKAFGIVVEMSLDHISFVEKPANPLCVVNKYSIPINELLRDLPEEEKDNAIYGETPIYCHHCLVCDGIESDQ